MPGPQPSRWLARWSLAAMLLGSVLPPFWKGQGRLGIWDFKALWIGMFRAFILGL